MSRSSLPTWFFVLVAVKRDKEFLLVHERKHGQRWYVPAGRVESGETLEAAAKRETLEETGVPVDLDGVVRFDHTPFADGTVRCRVIMLAHPVDDTPPKRIPDADSLEARWFSMADIGNLPLRGQDAFELLEYLSTDPPVAPMTILTAEGAKYQADL